MDYQKLLQEKQTAAGNEGCADDHADLGRFLYYVGFSLWPTFHQLTQHC